MNILVEIKNEYILRVNSILSKLIYEGLNSIYSKSKEVSKGDDVLKIFQSFLKRVPKWNQEILDNEVDRIKNSIGNENKFILLNDFIKASIRATYDILIIGMENRPFLKNYRTKLIEDFDFKSFIQEVYINCSKEVYNNPFLFYHNYCPVEIKRNQREVLEIVKKSIDISIKNFIPIELIVKEYLDDSKDSNRVTFKIEYDDNIKIEEGDQNENTYLNDLVKEDMIGGGISVLLNGFNKVESNVGNLNKVTVDQSIEPMIPRESIQPTNNLEEINPTNIENTTKDIDLTRSMIGGATNNENTVNTVIAEHSIENRKSSENRLFQSKVMDIIEEKNLNLSKDSELNETLSKVRNNDVNQTFISKEEDIHNTNPRIQVESRNDTNNSTNNSIQNIDTNRNSLEKKSLVENKNSIENTMSRTGTGSKSNSELDSKLEKLLKNDLGDSESDSSIIGENQSNYQEIFSNSNLSAASSNTADKNDELNKNKFFSNYLQF